MAQYFETACTYDKMTESGEVKKATEKFLVDALSFTEAEARTTQERQPYISGDFIVSAAKRTRIAEVTGDRDCGKFYLAKVAFITIDERTATEKRTATQMLVGAETFDAAVVALKEAMSTTMADWELTSLSESPIIEVYEAEE